MGLCVIFYIIFNTIIFDKILQSKIYLVCNNIKNNNFTSYTISNNTQDGSELVANDFGNESSKIIKDIFRLIKLKVGFECRIYIKIEKVNPNYMEVEISTFKMWKDSLFYFDDLIVNYSYDLNNNKFIRISA